MWSQHGANTEATSHLSLVKRRHRHRKPPVRWRLDPHKPLNELVLLEGIELSTSPLPRECSTIGECPRGQATSWVVHRGRSGENPTLGHEHSSATGSRSPA